jgi:hypothetical protein
MNGSSRYGRLLAAATVSLLSFSSAWAEAPITCPSRVCSCKQVPVHSCELQRDGTTKCRDVVETQCTIISGPGSGRAVMAPPGSGTPERPMKVDPSAPVGAKRT